MTKMREQSLNQEEVQAHGRGTQRFQLYLRGRLSHDADFISNETPSKYDECKCTFRSSIYEMTKTEHKTKVVVAPAQKRDLNILFTFGAHPHFRIAHQVIC